MWVITGGYYLPAIRSGVRLWELTSKRLTFGQAQAPAIPLIGQDDVYYGTEKGDWIVCNCAVAATGNALRIMGEIVTRDDLMESFNKLLEDRKHLSVEVLKRFQSAYPASAMFPDYPCIVGHYIQAENPFNTNRLEVGFLQKRYNQASNTYEIFLSQHSLILYLASRGMSPKVINNVGKADRQEVLRHHLLQGGVAIIGDVTEHCFAGVGHFYVVMNYRGTFFRADSRDGGVWVPLPEDFAQHFSTGTYAILIVPNN